MTYIFNCTIAMCKHETKICPRCHSAFECRVGDITRCQCYTVKLDDAARDLLARNYSDCLCADCIKAVTAVTPEQADNGDVL